jgi:neutral trehalase
VGLNSLYALDCACLAELATAIDRNCEARELESRGREIRRAITKHLWDPRQGIFANRYTSGERAFSSRISPTSFYPFFAGAAAEGQVNQMISNYLLNHEQFYGEWMLPSISRQDTAHKDQLYWRGRIWAPMNFLVYLGLVRTKQPVARRELARSSRELLLKEWRLYGHVHENQSSETGLGCDSERSDGFYHWGGLLGVVDLIERGIIPPPRMGDKN